MYFINKMCVYDMDVIKPQDFITCESLVKEATHEYHILVDSKRWESATGKEKYQDQPLFPKACTTEIKNQ